MGIFDETERKDLSLEINHILESGANDVRLIDMFERFLLRRGFNCQRPPHVEDPEHNGDPNCPLCHGRGYYSHSDFSGAMTFTHRCSCAR